MPDAHASEARKLDRLVFGENGHRGADVVADAVQRVQDGSRNDEGASGADRANPLSLRGRGGPIQWAREPPAAHV
jgi:hypothetical protein